MEMKIRPGRPDDAAFCAGSSGNIITNNLFTYSKNTPVVEDDYYGFCSLASYVSYPLYYKMLSIAASATSLLASIKTFVAMIWNVFLVVGLLLAVLAIIIYICKKFYKP